MKTAHLLILLPVFLAACKTVPLAPAVVQCPRVQPIQWPAQVPSFTAPMESFLRGKLPEPMASDYSLPPAKLPTTQP